VTTVTETVRKKVAVLDTSAFVAGFDPLTLDTEGYTVPLVEDEIRQNSLSGLRLRTAVESGRLKIRMPDEQCLKSVKSSATMVGDKFFLSETDLQVLALAHQLKTEGQSPLIITDDYSIQNVANQMNIPFASLATIGIRKRLQWVRYCPACRKQYPADSKLKTCNICGTRLRRKPLRKTSLNNKNIM
jgi:UPF0271 protein